MASDRATFGSTCDLCGKPLESGGIVVHTKANSVESGHPGFDFPIHFECLILALQHIRRSPVLSR